ncbi:hypothetical protein ACTG2S_13000 [Aeromonas sp. 82P]|nr:hypothetical protein [Aeromonas veronii]MDD1843910.1 hypothetical protein [Aeromonas veronii]
MKNNRAQKSPRSSKAQAPHSNTPTNIPSEEPNSPKYNVVYERLVNNNKDIIGLLAYCLYKQSKQLFIREFEKNNGKRPTDSELANHVVCSEIPKLSMYREEATRSVSLLLSQAAAEKEEELEEHFKERLWLFINKHEPEGFLERQWCNLKGLIYGGVGGVFGNFFTTALLVLFLFWAASTETRDGFFNSAKENLVSGLAQVIGVQVTISPDSNTKD